MELGHLGGAGPWPTSRQQCVHPERCRVAEAAAQGLWGRRNLMNGNSKEIPACAGVTGKACLSPQALVFVTGVCGNNEGFSASSHLLVHS